LSVLLAFVSSEFSGVAADTSSGGGSSSLVLPADRRLGVVVVVVVSAVDGPAGPHFEDESRTSRGPEKASTPTTNTAIRAYRL